MISNENTHNKRIERREGFIESVLICGYKRSTKEMTILELANLIRKLVKSDSEIVFEELPEDDPPRRKPGITKAKEIQNWEPKVGLREGLLKMIKWFV